MTYRAVPAAEKYLEGPRPVCDCHDEPMDWTTSADRPAGGRWTCAVSRRERIRLYYEANPKKERERIRRWRAANPKKERERKRLYRAANAEKINEYRRAWAEANSGKERERKRRWAAANRDTYVMHARRRRARKASALTVPFTREQLADRMAFWGNRCWMCGGNYESVDHVIPIARGGPDCLSNLRPACKSCNSSKGARPHGLVLAGR